ncbi:MAG: CBS domain-containing protein [Gemmatimonadota bacterium]
MRAPLTGVAFLVELTHDTNLLPGLLVACVAATLVTVLVLKRSILTEKVARRGHHVSREYGVNPLARLRVKDVMSAETGAIRWDLTLGKLFDGVIERDPAIDRRQAWPVIDDDDRLVGLLTRGGLLRALGRPSSSGQTVLSAATERLVVTYPSELLADAVGKMTRHGVGQLPVVAPDDPSRLMGYLGPAGIAAAWQAFVDEETVREDGWLTRRSRLVRRRVRRFLRPPATTRVASADRAEESKSGPA